MSDPLAGSCGDYCGKCPNWPEECKGCIPEDHGDCRFVRCCTERRIEHCGLCADFPCAELAAFCPDDRPGCPTGYHIENLKARAEMGTANWLERERKKWPDSEKPRA